MGRFHRHADGTVHSHDHGDHPHEHHDVGDHTGYQTGDLRVEVLEKILDENDRTAAANREDFHAAGVRAVNLMSSPGPARPPCCTRRCASWTAGCAWGSWRGTSRRPWMPSACRASARRWRS